MTKRNIHLPRKTAQPALLTSDVVPRLHYQIGEGTEYQWNCYGPNARFLDFNAKIKKTVHAPVVSIVYDTLSLQVYEIGVYPIDSHAHFVWRDPEFRKSHAKEAKNKNIVPDTYEVEIELSDDILTKAESIVVTGKCSNGVRLNIDLDVECFKFLSNLADQDKLTIKDAAEKILTLFSGKPNKKQKKAKP